MFQCLDLPVCQAYNEALTLLVDWQSGRRVPLCDWLPLRVRVQTTANADVDFCSKMASLTAVMQTNRSGSLTSSKKRTGMVSTRRFKLLDNSVLLLLSLASVLHCALADGKTLVLLDNLNIKDTHSIFFRSLAGQYDNTIFFFAALLTLLYSRIYASFTGCQQVFGS